MKRLVLAVAAVLLTVLAAGAQAGSLPKPLKMVDRMKVYSVTHYLRDGSPGGGSGGGSTATAEARQAPLPQPQAAQKSAPAPQPRRAD